MDRGRGIYVHKTDKKSIYELKRRKVDRRSVRNRKRVDRRQAGIASKDQIQQAHAVARTENRANVGEERASRGRGRACG